MESGKYSGRLFPAKGYILIWENFYQLQFIYIKKKKSSQYMTEIH